MCVMYVWTKHTYAKFKVNQFENGFHIVQKLRKCQSVKFSNSFSDQSMQHRKMKIAPLNSPSNSASKDSFCGKNNSFEIFIFFIGISHIHVLNFKLTLTSHLASFKTI